ncbi:MAG: ATP-binding protein [Rhodobacteraceae bacterium]|nr:ATP-binding protein [Paracoccaceae bacterium]
MTTAEKFRVSSYLKDIIGRDLVTNEYVATFELVKNAFDARTSRVDIIFDLEADTIMIVDDGHGMSPDDIRKKWLFVAHSDKIQHDYRDKIKPAGQQVAGNKGIGRFACDTLGKGLELYSRADGQTLISKLDIDWTLFEAQSTEEFQQIDVRLGTAKHFPDTNPVRPPAACGTVLVITRARHEWDEDKIGRLRSHLAKLIDPFGTTKSTEVSTWLVGTGEHATKGLNGPVGNDIADLLGGKTSRIKVLIADGMINTELFDRGRKIYEVKEPSPYNALEGSEIKGEIFFLNRAAKNNFTRRMGLQPVRFGSIFLFLNGFRVFPVGEETDDTLGLNRRKQQRASQHLGTRDVLGRVDVTAPPKRFREASSRDAGLIEDARSRALFEVIMTHMVFRLEKYVVGVNWKDKQDRDRETADGLEIDSTRGRILDLVGSLARRKDIDVVYYDDALIRLSSDPDQITDAALNSMSRLAKRSGNTSLLEQIEDARRRIEELKKARDEARDEAKRATEDRARADALVERLEHQVTFLGSSKDVDVERIQLLMHQAIIYSGHMRAAIRNANSEVRNILDLAVLPDSIEEMDDLDDLLASIRQSARRLSSSLAGGSLTSDQLREMLSFSQNIRVDLAVDRIEGDLLKFFAEFIGVRLTGIPDMPEVRFSAPDLMLRREFSPVDIAVLINNLVDNARKAKAHHVEFKASKKRKGCASIFVKDDGLGIDNQTVDPSKIFERGYTSFPRGTGIGLYSAKKIIKAMDGELRLIGDGTRADFEIIIPGEMP